MSMTVERLAAQRRTLLIGTLVGFGLWQVGAIAAQLTPANGPIRGVELAAELGGWLVWAAFLVRTRIWRGHVTAAIGRALADELWRHRTLVSCAVALVAIIATQALIILIAVAAPSPPTAALAAQISIDVGVLTAIGTFLYLDRD